MTIQQFLQLMENMNIYCEKIDSENYWIYHKSDFRIHFDTETSEIYPLECDEDGNYHPITEEELIEKLKA